VNKRGRNTYPTVVAFVAGGGSGSSSSDCSKTRPSVLTALDIRCFIHSRSLNSRWAGAASGRFAFEGCGSDGAGGSTAGSFAQTGPFLRCINLTNSSFLDSPLALVPRSSANGEVKGFAQLGSWDIEGSRRRRLCGRGAGASFAPYRVQWVKRTNIY